MTWGVLSLLRVTPGALVRVVPAESVTQAGWGEAIEWSDENANA